MPKRFYSRYIISAILLIALTLTVLPTLTANARAFTKDDETGKVTVTEDYSYFYRLPYNAAGTALPLTGDNADDTYVYGYGYSYNNNTGVYTYGYGFGYGYAYFALTGDSWTAGDAGLGTFQGTSGETSNNAQLSMNPDTRTATVGANTTLGGADIGVTGAAAYLPTGLEITGGVGWNGYIGASATTTIPAGSNIASGVTFTLDTGDTDVTLLFSVPVVLKIPNSTFDSSTGLVEIVAGGVTYTPKKCSDLTVAADEVAGFTPVAPAASSSYSTLKTFVPGSTDSGSHCYYFDGTNVYVGTRHASTFSTGNPAASVSSTTQGSPTGGSSSKKKKVATVTEEDTTGEEDVTGEEDITTETLAEQYTDLEGIPETDWKYIVIKAVSDIGLFRGEMINGKQVFNMEGGMNRAMAATVIARYIGCEETHLTETPFSDVPVNEWYASSISCLKEKGIVAGKTPLIYAPADLVTRAEFLKLMIEGYLYNNPILEAAWRLTMSSPATIFEDVASDDWYAGYMNAAPEYDVLEGYNENGKTYAKPDQTIIRIEAAAIVSNFLGLDVGL